MLNEPEHRQAIINERGELWFRSMKSKGRWKNKSPPHLNMLFILTTQRTDGQGEEPYDAVIF